MNDSCEDVIDAVHADVDREQKADQDLVGKDKNCLQHMEAVSCKGCRYRRPAKNTITLGKA